MGGFFSYRTVLFGVGSGPLVWGRGLTQHRAHTNCFVDDPIHPVERNDITKAEIGNGRLVVVEQLWG